MPAEAKAKSQHGARRQLARNLLNLRLKHAKIFGEMDSLKAALIGNATKAGDGFREVFDKLGQVTVAAAKPKSFQGDQLAIDPDAFYALSEAKRSKLMADGLVKVVSNWTREFRGRVDVKIFGA